MKFRSIIAHIVTAAIVTSVAHSVLKEVDARTSLTQAQQEERQRW